MDGLKIYFSLRSYYDSYESDLRFVYTGLTICYLLKDFSVLNLE